MTEDYPSDEEVRAYLKQDAENAVRCMNRGGTVLQGAEGYDPSAWTAGSLGLCGEAGTADCTPEACEPLCGPAEEPEKVWPICGPPNREAQEKADALYRQGIAAKKLYEKPPLQWVIDNQEVLADRFERAGEKMELEAVNHPKHYTSHASGIECIQITEHMGFCLGNAVKYIWRADDKGNAIEDLQKAAWYIQREIERRTGMDSGG